MEVIYFLGGFFVLCALFALIDRLHSRWAWRQSVREANALMGQRPPRPSPPSPVPAMADTIYGCEEHYYDGCPNCGRGRRSPGVALGDPTDKLSRCNLGCLEYGQCKANMHGVPSECPSLGAKWGGDAQA